MAKLRKNNVKNNGFWKINANRFLETLAKARIRPEDGAERGSSKIGIKQIGEDW